MMGLSISLKNIRQSQVFWGYQGEGGGGRIEKDQWHKMGLTNSLVRGHTLFKNHINNNFKKCHKMLVLLVITKDFKEIVFGLKLI